MRIHLPETCLVALIGASGSGKSSFGRKHFKPTEVISSDYCRGLVSDNENDQSATNEAFDLLHYIAAKRLTNLKMVVVDATNVQTEARKPLVTLAKRHHLFAFAIVLNMPERLCHERNESRPDRQFGPHVVRNQSSQLRRSIGALKREGFRQYYVLDTPEEVEAAEIVREPMWSDRRSEKGPFDIIGDVHGCYDELCELLTNLGYEDLDSTPRHPAGRKIFFVGDLVDRGPKTPAVLRLAMNAVEAGTGLCVPGNHDDKLSRALQGRAVNLTHGLAQSMEQLDQEPPEFKEKALGFIQSLVSHLVVDGGKLVVAHAGMKAELQGRSSGRVREFALYGETRGEMDEMGLPIRYNWAEEYRGKSRVVYGHTPILQPEWLNRTLNIDTGCVFGGKLTALRYPEMEVVSVPSRAAYAESRRWAHTMEEAAAAALTAQQRHDDVLDLQDVVGKRLIETGLHRSVTIREENAIAALEVMSRFAVDPRWLIYLPPTMSPSETTARPSLLEHPDEALAYFRAQGVTKVVCEEKHMGSRAVVVLCRDEDTARRRFGAVDQGFGICYTRTGRRFFDEPDLETRFLDTIRRAMDAADLWAELETDWICLDCELMPWSARAQGLLTGQYAPVGAASRASLDAAQAAIQAAAARGVDMGELPGHIEERREAAHAYVAAYRRYCWPVRSLEDLRLAPFHILASEGRVHTDRDHVWHMEALKRLCAAADGVLFATPYRVVDLLSEEETAGAVAWWEALTAEGGEGMVVKPLDFVARHEDRLVQPAVKCRGREYLRIIYGPDYLAERNLSRLRKRSLGAKRSLALREFALSVEGLQRFVNHEPLQRVHECAFGVLALESEPVDPRL